MFSISIRTTVLWIRSTLDHLPSSSKQEQKTIKSIMKIFIVLALVAAASAVDVYSKPAYSAPAYSAPAYKESYAPAYYNFDWAVKDDYSYVNMGHQENRNGDNTKGSYFVDLPDGRRQTVNYYVDGYSGYVADVQYSGEAKAYAPAYQPAYKPATYVAQPAYKPVAPVTYVAPAAKPVYQPAPYVAPVSYAKPAYQPAPYVAPVSYAKPAYQPAPYVAPVKY